MKIFLVSYFIFFVLFCLVMPTYRIWREQKILAITFKNTDNAHDYIGKLFKLVILAAGFPAFMYLVNEERFNYLLPVGLPGFCFELGLFIMIISLFWVMLAQIQMEKSWRIGIDYGHKTDLVHKGLFTMSRNPIYFGMHGSLLGFFLVLPNIFSLMVLLIAHILMQIQTRLEEEYLEKMHGDSYLSYKAKVRRWI